MNPNTYKGFSTVFDQGNKKYTLTGFDLIKQDFLNALNTRKGSRVMNPREGTILWEMIFEPITDDTKTLIVNDLTTIVSKDPRLALDTIDITTVNNQVVLELGIIYVKEDVADTMRIVFDANSLQANFQ